MVSAFARIFRFLTSLKLAVVTIVLLGILSAIGTIYEARYDAEYAQKLIYHSKYMYGVMILLIINLIAVMVDRWPWKRRHAAFVLAHIGIIITLIGSVMTQHYGLDGTMAFKIGESRGRVTVRERDLVVYGSFDGSEVRPLLQKNVDFITKPPSEAEPFSLEFGGEKIEIIESHHLAFREETIVASDRDADGPALRFQLKNDNVNVTEWIKRESSKPFEEFNLGPAKIVLSDGSYRPALDENEIVFSPGQNKDELRYAVYDKKNLLKARGVIKESQSFDVGWMGLKLNVLRYHPKAFQRVSYTPAESSSPLAHSALKFKFQGQEYWLGIGSLMRLYTKDRMYIVAYVFRQVDLGFQLALKDFTIGHYEGTTRAASYQSLVVTPESEEVLISMNEPLKYKGFTFYQASFEQDEMGKPTTSVLSVNHDPGRWVKYLGSFLIVLGSILLFYFKKMLARKPGGG